MDSERLRQLQAMVEQANTNKVYTVKEAAKVLKVSEKIIWGMIDRQELDASKVGRQWRIKAASVEKHL
jgi:excisionase family DNA binding protein